MAKETECQTPGAQYHTHITNDHFQVNVEFGRTISLNTHEAELLETNLHNAIELVLAPYYMPGQSSELPRFLT